MRYRFTSIPSLLATSEVPGHIVRFLIVASQIFCLLISYICFTYLFSAPLLRSSLRLAQD